MTDHAPKIRPAGRGTAIVVLDGRSIGLVREAGFPVAKWTAERVDQTLLDGLYETDVEAAAAIVADLDPYRETLSAMSDQAIRHQLVAGAPGGRQRAAILAEARRRGIQS